MNQGITCTEFEILLADLLDGTLAGEQKSAVEAHLAGCASCAELARDASGAVAFMERAAAVEPPPAMVNRILFEITSGPSRRVVKPSLVERLLGPWVGNILQPRFAMGMAMAVLSLAMVGRFWAAAESGVHRAWDRAVKGYENLELVYQVQTQLEEWNREIGSNPAQDSGGAQNNK